MAGTVCVIPESAAIPLTSLVVIGDRHARRQHLRLVGGRRAVGTRFSLHAALIGRNSTRFPRSDPAAAFRLDRGGGFRHMSRLAPS
jgi:hypothetical protein